MEGPKHLIQFERACAKESKPRYISVNLLVGHKDGLQLSRKVELPNPAFFKPSITTICVVEHERYTDAKSNQKTSF